MNLHHGAREIRPICTQLRQPWTNGFVERLQGTILNEVWRVEFRRRFFLSVTGMWALLVGYLRFYNEPRARRVV